MDHTEREFQDWVSQSGFEVGPSQAIYCDPPVEDRHGNPVKNITTPDFYIKHYSSGRTMYIEVTQGSGGGPHKAAQQRVVEAAGVENYYVFKGDELAELMAITDAEAREAFLVALFEWYDLL